MVTTQPDASSEGTQAASRAASAVCLATATVTGAAVMMLELLGTRVIGPFYGVSMFVWSSLISVTLISLAVGYFLGGRLADSGRMDLSAILVAAGLATAAVPLLRVPVLTVTNGLGLRAGAFLSALMLFFIPLTILAMVGPYVVKMLVARREKVGTVSGSVMALSTVGSVVGTLMLGFFLLPLVGTQTILYAIAGVLMFGGVGLRMWFRAAGSRKHGSPSALVALCLVGGSVGAIERSRSNSQDDYRLVYEAESPYARIRVLDDQRRSVRWLMSDASVISAYRIGTNEVPFPYLALLQGLPHYNPQGKRALVVGMGAGYLPMVLEEHGVATDAIEIDPEVVRAAAEFFPFKRPRRLIVGDARYEVSKLTDRYDFIIHDCFTGGSVPAHVLSVEMLRTLRTRLNDGGIFALNFFGFNQGADAAALEAVVATIRAVFPHTRVLTTQPGANPIDNIVFASDRPIVAATHDGACSLSPRAWSFLEGTENREVLIPTTAGFVITDDFNPLETLQIPKAEAYRNGLASRLGLAALIQ